jgi:hypothetical protein
LHPTLVVFREQELIAHDRPHFERRSLPPHAVQHQRIATLTSGAHTNDFSGGVRGTHQNRFCHLTV